MTILIIITKRFIILFDVYKYEFKINRDIVCGIFPFIFLPFTPPPHSSYKGNVSAGQTKSLSE